MIKFFNVIILLVLIFKTPSSQAGVTEEQMWAAGKLMRDVCLPKFPKITTDIANDIRFGDIPDTKEAKCYINCILELMQTMKKGKFKYEASLKQVELLLPDSYKADYPSGLAACKGAAIGIKDHCEASYTMLVCLRKHVAKFVFP